MGAGEVVAMGGETRLLESNAQLGFGFAQPASTEEVEPAPREERFLSGAEGDFFVGDQGLAEYLVANQQGWVVKLKVLVSELDYSPFYGRYKDDGGRRPIHPRVMLGLVVYGITQGKWSLRELERLARMDLGALWMSGRVQPDHSTIGKFIQLHAELLSEQFFTALVKQLVRKLHLSAGTVGLDGTVIAAAASHYRMLRAEALREATLSEQAERILVERQAARELAGRAGAATLLAPQEPEAVVQPTTHGPLRPSYKTVGAASRKWAGDRAGGACEQRDRGGDGLVATAPGGVRGCAPPAVGRCGLPHARSVDRPGRPRDRRADSGRPDLRAAAVGKTPSSAQTAQVGVPLRGRGGRLSLPGPTSPGTRRWRPRPPPAALYALSRRLPRLRPARPLHQVKDQPRAQALRGRRDQRSDGRRAPAAGGTAPVAPAWGNHRATVGRPARTPTPDPLPSPRAGQGEA